MPGERKRLTKLIAEQITPDAGAWLDRVEADTLAALRERGEATAKELTTAVPDLASKLRMGEGKAWGVTVGMSTRVLFLLATEAKIVRGRPLGTWLSSQYRWVPTELWFGDRIVMDAAAARTELARRWLATFGPATLTDLRWWAGWTAADARHALDAIGAVEVEVTTTAYVLPDDSAVDSTADFEDPEPWVALLPSLDPAVMGWKEREWFLGAHQAALFDRNGNVGPTVWSNGRIVGGWAQRPDGDVVVRVLEDVGNEVLAAIDLEAGSLTDWLGGIRLTPRMRTPLERELST